MNSAITLTILIITCLISIICFGDRKWFDRLAFNAYQVRWRKQYYRLITHGFVHGNWAHLLINMLVFFSFGGVVETYYEKFAIGGSASYLTLYLLTIPVSSLLSLKKYKDNPNYNAVGASGAVNAIVFSFVFLDPWSKLYLFFAIPIPGIIFGGLYLWYSYAMSKKESDGVGHDAHFLGAIFGVVFTAIFIPHSFTNFFVRLREF
jgi:membrane associated rhomboid family serine protease